MMRTPPKVLENDVSAAAKGMIGESINIATPTGSGL
tara:strand:+ start:260 stop:367 length:108 start_codon:yes stop_codon:yes gene_type:complete